MKDGKVIDSFVGALPEADVVAFVQRVLDASSDAAPVDESSEDAHDGQGDAIEDSPIEPTPMAQTAAPTISEPGADVIPSAPAPSAAEADAIETELQTLLTTVKGDDAARERFLELLDALGAEDPRTNLYRRKLATALY